MNQENHLLLKLNKQMAQRLKNAFKALCLALAMAARASTIAMVGQLILIVLDLQRRPKER